MLKHELGLKLRKLREFHGLTQRELAERLYTTDKSISRWENGDSFISLEMLSEVLFILGNTPFLIQNKQLKLGDEIMNKLTIFNQSLEDFNVSLAKEEILNQRRASLYQHLTEMQKAFEYIDEEGMSYEKRFLPTQIEFSDAQWCDPEAQVELRLIHPEKESYDLALHIFNFDRAEGHFFNLFKFLEVVASHHGEEIRQQLEKVIYFVCLKEGQGEALYRAFEQCQIFEEQDVVFGMISPLLSPFQKLLHQCLKQGDFVEPFCTEEGLYNYQFLRSEEGYFLEALNLLNYEVETAWTYAWYSHSKEESFFEGNINTLSEEPPFFNYLEEAIMMSVGHYYHHYQEVECFFNNEECLQATRGFYE